MSDHQFNFEVQVDADVIHQSKPTQRVLEMSVFAPTAKMDTQRVSLNLAIVLDRSGSMRGEKLEAVKQAALHVVDLLGEQDRVAIVVYDTNVEVISKSIPVTSANRLELKNSIQAIQCGNTTNLSGGWFKGCEEIAEHLMEEEINRVLLLTDGLANHGITDLEKLGQHAGQLLQRGISTSTFGVGHGFNEHLLEHMANQGGGRFYFISRAAQIPEIFAQEFNELAAITARQIKIDLKIPAGVSTQVLGSWRTDQHQDKLTIWLGDLAGGQKREVYCKLLTPPQKDHSEICLTLVCSANDEAGEEIVEQKTISLRYANEGEVNTTPLRKEVMQRYSMVEIADQATQALILERRGEREKASRILKQGIQAAAPYLAQDSVQEYETLSEKMAHGLDEETRKTNHQMAYLRKQRR